MPSRRQSKNDREFIATLKAQSASLAATIDVQTAELAANVERKSRIDATIASFDSSKPAKQPKSSTARARNVQAPKPENILQAGKFHGMSLQEAARKQLSIVEKPQTAQEIWPVLSAAGFISASERPSNAVQWALRKRERMHGDVLLVGAGQWGLPEWYLPDEIEAIKKRLGGMAGRNKKTHSEKTKLGMELSRKRGVRIGAKVKITPELIKRLQAHIASGESIIEACKREKISAGSFHLLKRKGVPGLNRLTGAARRKAVEKAKAKTEAAPADLLTPRVEGSVVH